MQDQQSGSNPSALRLASSNLLLIWFRLSTGREASWAFGSRLVINIECKVLSSERLDLEWCQRRDCHTTLSIFLLFFLVALLLCFAFASLQC